MIQFNGIKDDVINWLMAMLKKKIGIPLDQAIHRSTQEGEGGGRAPPVPSPKTSKNNLIQWKPLNVIALGQRETDNMFGMLAIS